jgi:predicted kinase
VHLVILAGLPGSGKSTLARALGREAAWPVLCVDTVELALLEAGLQPGVAGYLAVQALASQQLAAGLSCVVDAVHPVSATREIWKSIAASRQATLHFIEVVCSNPEIHRLRVEVRRREEGELVPDWKRVLARKAEYEPWTERPLQVDSCEPLEQNLAKILRLFNGQKPP